MKLTSVIVALATFSAISARALPSEQDLETREDQTNLYEREIQVIEVGGGGGKNSNVCPRSAFRQPDQNILFFIGPNYW